MSAIPLLALLMAPVGPPPVIGLHIGAPSPSDLPLVLDFIKTDLPKAGVNTLVVEFGYAWQSKTRPEVAKSGLSAKEITQIAEACKASKVRLIPQINMLGHQSWAEGTSELLTVHPEFDETPGKYPNNKGIYCRSYCPLHPGVHAVVFDLIDELAQLCQTDAFHVGMDEVFILADPDCPRCAGKDPATLFAGEVTKLHGHLASKGLQMWMWGDRFIDGKATGIGEWEAATNGTAPAIDAVPTDIVIADWHYEYAPPTPSFFAVKGFPVVASAWRKTNVALDQLAQIQVVREGANRQLANRLQGVLHTTWCSVPDFIRAFRGEEVADVPARESAAAFKALTKAASETPAAG